MTSGSNDAKKNEEKPLFLEMSMHLCERRRTHKTPKKRQNSHNIFGEYTHQMRNSIRVQNPSQLNTQSDRI